jgi:hypothetical protein
VWIICVLFRIYFSSVLVSWLWVIDISGRSEWAQYKVERVAVVNNLMKLKLCKSRKFLSWWTQLYISFPVFIFVNHNWVRGETDTCSLLRELWWGNIVSSESDIRCSFVICWHLGLFSDEYEWFVAGIQYAGAHLREVQKAFKNPAANLGLIFEEATKRAIQSVGLSSPPALTEHVHPNLSSSAALAAKASTKFLCATCRISVAVQERIDT